MTRATTLYRMFLRVRGAAPVAPVVLAILVVVGAITTVAIRRVSRQHEVLRLGYQLTQRSKVVDRLREAQRQLQVERATLTSPDRIKHLATALGMTTVAPDRIRVIERQPQPPVVGTTAPGSRPAHSLSSRVERDKSQSSRRVNVTARDDRKVALLP